MPKGIGYGGQPKSMGERVVRGVKAVGKGMKKKGDKIAKVARTAGKAAGMVPKGGIKGVVPMVGGSKKFGKAVAGGLKNFHKTKAFKALDKIAPGPSVTKKKINKIASKPIPRPSRPKPRKQKPSANPKPRMKKM